MGTSSLKILLFILLTSCATTISNSPGPSDGSGIETPPVITDPETPNESKVIFTGKTDLEWLQTAIKSGNCVVNVPKFYEEIAKVENYDETDLTPKQISEKISESTNTIAVYSYVRYFSKVIAKFQYGNIYLNSRKQVRKPEYNANTIVHEWTHSLGFTHDGNYAKGQQDTVPYKVGDIAEKIYLEFCK